MEYTLMIAGMLFGVMALPVLLPAFLIWTAMGLPATPLDHGTPSALFGIFSLIAGWMIWKAVLARTAFVIGLYDPYRNAASAGKAPYLSSLIRISSWIEMIRKFGKEHTGRWASLFEAIAHPYRHGDVPVGTPWLWGFGLLRPVGLEAVRHWVVMGAMGSGKSTALFIPWLCLHKGSCVVTDLKGELATITAGRQKRMGKECYIIDPAGQVSGHETARYCPFSEMRLLEQEDPDAVVGFGAKIVDALRVNLSPKDPFWDDKAKTIEKGITFYGHVTMGEEMNLIKLYELCLYGDETLFWQSVEQGEIDPDEDGMSAVDTMAAKMVAMRHGPYGEIIAAAGQEIMDMPEKTRGGVFSVIKEDVEFLSDPQVRKTCEGSDFYYRDLKRKKMAVYRSIPLAWLGLKQMRLLRMHDLLSQNAIMRDPHIVPKDKVLLLLDEFTAAGKIDGLEQILPIMRSLGGLAVIGVQTRGQIVKTYGEHGANMIFGNAESIQVLQTGDPDTLQKVAGQLGKRSFIRKEKVRDGKGRIQKRPVRAEHPLMTAEQLKRFLNRNRGYQVILRSEDRPMRLKLRKYYEYLPFWYYDPDPRYPEKAKRAFWRKAAQKWRR